LSKQNLSFIKTVQKLLHITIIKLQQHFLIGESLCMGGGESTSWIMVVAVSKQQVMPSATS
jgi:hypothetical protein